VQAQFVRDSFAYQAHQETGRLCNRLLQLLRNWRTVPVLKRCTHARYGLRRYSCPPTRNLQPKFGNFFIRRWTIGENYTAPCPTRFETLLTEGNLPFKTLQHSLLLSTPAVALLAASVTRAQVCSSLTVSEMADAALLAWLEAKQLAPAFARAFDEDVGLGVCDWAVSAC
jgi:hypothetical protein